MKIENLSEWLKEQGNLIKVAKDEGSSEYRRGYYNALIDVSNKLKEID